MQTNWKENLAKNEKKQHYHVTQIIAKFEIDAGKKIGKILGH